MAREDRKKSAILRNLSVTVSFKICSMKKMTSIVFQQIAENVSLKRVYCKKTDKSY